MSETANLQLEHAEYETPQVTTCVLCSAPLESEYYEANGATVCASCAHELRSVGTQGTSVTRGLRALSAGFVAAVAGSLLYYAILALTGYEIGLIAIAVGFGVGKAVKWGSHGRGGWRYQTIAVALTYLAIVSSFVTLAFSSGPRKPDESNQATVAEASATPGDASVAPIEQETPEDLTATQTVVLLASFVGLILALPFLGGIENALGIVIIGIGLYEAWKINRKFDMTVTGPHAIVAPQAT